MSTPFAIIKVVAACLRSWKRIPYRPLPHFVSEERVRSFSQPKIGYKTIANLPLIDDLAYGKMFNYLQNAVIGSRNNSRECCDQLWDFLKMDGNIKLTDEEQPKKLADYAFLIAAARWGVATFIDTTF